MKTAVSRRIARQRTLADHVLLAARFALALLCIGIVTEALPHVASACTTKYLTDLRYSVSESPEKAKRGDPIILADGAAEITDTDIVLPGAGSAWSFTRQYSSKLPGGTYILGEGWVCDWFTAFCTGDTGDVTMYLDHVIKRTIDESEGSYTPPADFPVEFTHNTTDHYFVVRDKRTRETRTFYDGSATWPVHKRGLLYTYENRDGNKTEYSYDSTEKRILSITTPTEQSVTFSYISSGTDIGRISTIDVKNDSGQVIQRVKYVYYQYGHNAPDCGTDGDLIMVKVLKRKTDDDWTQSGDAHFSIVRATMYRYYGYGLEHKIRYVFSPASVEKAMAAASLTYHENLLYYYLTDGLGGGTLSQYANVEYNYYTSDFPTDDVNDGGQNDGGVGGSDENLHDKYGGSNCVETGFVKSQTIHKDYKGNLGTRTYFYMENPDRLSNKNAVKRIVVEDCGTDGTRKIYGLSGEGLMLREIFVDDPDAQTPTYWCTSYVLGETDDASTNNVNQVIEKRMPSVHSCIDSTADVFAFLDVDQSEENEWDSVDIMNQTSGIVYTYKYDAEGHLTEEHVKKGEDGEGVNKDEHYLRIVTYGDGTGDKVKYLPWETYVFHKDDKTGTDDSKRFKTTITYTFHDGNKQMMATKTVTRDKVGLSENGSDVDIVTKEYYDQKGRLRWAKDGEGYVTYYSHHPVTGGLAYVSVDCNAVAQGLPADIQNGSNGKWEEWGTSSPPDGFVRTDGLPTPLALVTKYEYDDLGRQIKVEDPKHVVTATAYCDNETRVYPGWNDSAEPKQPLPIRVEKTNDDDLTTEMYTVKPSGLTEIGVKNDLPSGSDTGEGQDDYATWTRYGYDYDFFQGYKTGLLRTVDRYHVIPASGDGTLSTNYYRTIYNHDLLGRRTDTIQIVSGTGTGTSVEEVTRTNYDVLGRVSYTERFVSGASHTIGDYRQPYLNPENARKTVLKLYYDESTPGSHNTAGVGDGLVTSRIEFYDASHNEDEDYAVKPFYHYNWRGQLRGIQPEAAPYTVQDVDNLGRVVATAQFTSTANFGNNWATVLGNDSYADSATDANRRTLAKTLYDEMGRVYATQVYAVTSAGVKGDCLRTDNYYDRNSRLVGTTSPGRGATEYGYDGAGRRTEVRALKELKTEERDQVTYHYDSNGKFLYRNPKPGDATGGNDGVCQIARTTYDAAGNVTQTVTLEMNDDDTTSPGISLTDHDFVQTFVYSWYEDRTYHLRGTANYGTNTSGWQYQGTAPTPGDDPPNRSDTVLVTTYTYDDDGRLQAVTDPKGIDTTYTYDDLGRTTQVVEADGEPEERWTLTQYDGLSNVTQRVADLNENGSVDAGDQVTTYTYHDNTRSPYHADRPTRIKYPDGDDTDDNVEITYVLDGRSTKRTAQKLAGQQNRTEITFEYDGTFRRLVEQNVTTAAGVDTSVSSITTTLDSLGRVEYVTSHSDSDPDTTNFSDAVNQVKYTYNDFGALDKEYQEHVGKVDGETLYVQYGYDDTDSSPNDGVFDKAMRLKSVRYPNGRMVYRLYTDPDDNDPYEQSGLGDAISRVTAIAADTTRGQNDANVYAAYAYNGAARVAEVTHPRVTNGLALSRKGASSGAYPGFDRFGRVRWQKWTNSAGDWKDVTFYGYDYASNPTYRCSWRAGEKGVNNFSEAYKYDNLHRLIRAQRGCLHGGDGTTSLRAPVGGDANKDGVINSSDYDKIDAGYRSGGNTWEEGDFNGDGVVNSSDYDIIDTNWLIPPTRNVTRTWDWSLDALGNWAGYDYDEGDGTSWDLEQERDHNDANEIDTDNNDSNGPDDDAITESAGSSWLSPKYDARGNMTSGPRPGAETTRHHYVYDAWNRLVEVKDDSGGSPDETIAEYRYDALGRRITRIVKDGENWDRTDFYYTTSWQVLEERLADDVTTANKGNLATNVYRQYVWDPRYIDAPVCRDEDLHDGSGGSPDGDCTDSDDEHLYYAQDANFNTTALVSAAGTVVERYVYDPYGKVTIWNEARTSTLAWADSKKNEILFCGYRYDPETSLYHVRHRMYHSTLGRWLQRDPLGYVDGMGLYQYVGSMPGAATDPEGLAFGPSDYGMEPLGWSAVPWGPTTERLCPQEGDFRFGLVTFGPGPFGGQGLVQVVIPGIAGQVVETFKVEWITPLHMLGGPYWQLGGLGGAGGLGGGAAIGLVSEWYWGVRDMMKAWDDSTFGWAMPLISGLANNPCGIAVGAYKGWRALPEGQGLAPHIGLAGVLEGGAGFVSEGGLNVRLHAVRDSNEAVLTVGGNVGGGIGTAYVGASAGPDAGMVWGARSAEALTGSSVYADLGGGGRLGLGVSGHLNLAPKAASVGAAIGAGADVLPPGGHGKITLGPAGQVKVYSARVPVSMIDTALDPLLLIDPHVPRRR